MNGVTREQLLRELMPIKKRINDQAKSLSDFSEILKARSDISQTDLEIQQIESDRAITDLEIQVAELSNA